VAKTGDLRFAIGAVGITNGNLDDFEAQPRCTEDGIKIGERIEVAEITACVLDAEIVGAVKLCGTKVLLGQRFTDTLAR
jgi:hypothetical protein